MRDGVRIAVDIHLPELEPGKKAPTILRQTRYHRSRQGGLSAFRSRFLSSGYAWVDVDARGSGASFGPRPHPWSEDEVRDGAEIVDWIVSQSWSDGRVGSMGGSYDGTCAEFLLVNQHPAVKAIAPLYTLFDVYSDIAFPGGIHQFSFTLGWSRVNAVLDANLTSPGVAPVDSDSDRSDLRAAIGRHRQNYNAHELSLPIVFRDDLGGGERKVTLDQFSPHSRIDDLKTSRAAVYSYSGWLDGAYSRAAVRRHLTLDNPANRLLLGPWDHGGKNHISPSNPSPNSFDHAGELLAFFDLNLRGVSNRLAERPRVRYFTLVEEVWKDGASWPPASERHVLHLGEDRRLGGDPGVPGSDVYDIDLEAATGRLTRWDSLLGGLSSPGANPDRAERDRRLLTYDSEPLQEDLEVTGHPIVRLTVSTDRPDGALFAYLEDVAPDGSVAHVSEGILRLIHRRLSAGWTGVPPQQKDSGWEALVPQRTFLRLDAQPMAPGRPAEIVFDLLPTSYRFRKGHSIRLAIAGADKDHFAPIPDGATRLTIHRGPGLSSIELPVVN